MKAKRMLVFALACLMLLSAFAIPAWAEGTAEKKHIVWAHYNSEENLQSAMQKMIDVYNRDHPDVYVELQLIPSDQFITVYKTRISAGDAPDIMQGKPRNLTEFVEGGHFMDLTGAPFLENVFDLLLEECSVDGKVYSLPLDTQVKGTFYNKQMFADLGLEPPTTIDEFFAVCDAFQAEGILPITHSYNFVNGVFHELDAFFTAMAVETGNERVWVDSQSGAKELTGNAVVKEAFEIFSRLASYKDPGDAGIDQGQAVQDFAAGKRPMYTNGGWLIGDLVAANPDGEYGIFPSPWSNDPAQNKMFVGIDNSFIISSTTPYKEEIFELFETFMGPECTKIWMDEALAMTSSTDVSVDDASDYVKSVAALIAEGRTVAKAFVRDYTSECQTAFRTMLQGFVVLPDAERDVDQLIADIDAEIAAARQ